MSFPRTLMSSFDRRRFVAGAAATGGVALAGRAALAQTPLASPPAASATPALPGVSHRQVETNGVRLHLAEAGSGPLVIMVHGFPETWYSWRHQLPALAAAGYHAVAVDMRGYGESDIPAEVAAYSLRNQIADLIGVIDALGEEQAVLVGHDVGAGPTWAAAELHPERVAAHITFGINYSARTPQPPTAMIGEFAGDHFNFALYAQEPGVADAEFAADPRRSLRMFFYNLSGDAPPEIVPYLFEEKPNTEGFFAGLPDPDTLPAWLTDDDLDVYTAAFERTGFTPAFNGYRNFDSDWADLPEVGTVGVQQPCLYLGGLRDPAVMYTLGGLPAMQQTVPNLREIVLWPGCGHWTQQERPAAVNQAMIAFLQQDIPA